MAGQLCSQTIFACSLSRPRLICRACQALPCLHCATRLSQASAFRDFSSSNPLLICHAVWLDGQRLRMAEGETEQEHILALTRGELMLDWNLFRPDVGHAVEITSGARRPAAPLP